MEIYDRVITKEDFMSGDNLIPNGTIGTIRHNVGSTIIVQIDYVDGKQKLISAPINYLQKAKVEDLDAIDTLTECVKIVNPLFHPGNKYITPDNNIFTITGIKLATNEKWDLFQINKSTTFVDRKFIDEASHIPYEEVHLTVEEETIKQQIDEAFEEETEEISNQPLMGSDIKITIDTIEFNIRDNNINLGTITKDKMEVYVNALIKLKNLLN